MEESAEIQIKVHQLLNLTDGLRHFSEVVHLGEKALPALESLLRGPSESIFEPRCLVADAITAVGGNEAVDALLRALQDCSSRNLDAVFRYSEYAVVNRIAENLGRLNDPRASEPLLSLLNEHPFSGCLRGLLFLREPRVIPLAVRWLRDDFAKDACIEVIKHFGLQTVPSLISLLKKASHSPSEKNASATAARLLGEMKDSRALPTLMNCLHDSSPIVRLGAAIGLTHMNDPSGAQAALAVLTGFLTDEDPFRISEVSDALLRIPQTSEPAMIRTLDSDSSVEAGLHRIYRALEILGEIRSPTALQAIGNLSEHPDGRIRLKSIQVLGTLQGIEAAAFIQRFVSDPDPKIRTLAVEYLGKDGLIGARFLKEALPSSHWLLRRKIRKTLLKNG